MNHRAQPPLLADVAVGLAAGLVATWATDLVQGPLRRATPDSVRRREERVSPGPSSSHVAARRIAERLGRPVEDRRLRPVAKAVHYGLGMLGARSTACCGGAAACTPSAWGSWPGPRCCSSSTRG
jgi:hypothetical protein